jgi:hypothetical protein
LDAQELSGRDEEREVGTSAEKRRELRCSVDHLLEVVEQEQELALVNVLGEPVLGAERLGDRL